MGNRFLKAYDEYYDMIYRYVYARMGNKWDTDDIVSEVFKKAYENYQSVTSSEKAWLFAIARNTMNDFYRRNKHKTVELDEVFCSVDSPLEEGLIKRNELDCLRNTLETLDEEELDLITLRYFSNLKYDEIAKAVGRESGYLRVKVSRTIKKIGAMLIKCLEG